MSSITVAAIQYCAHKDVVQNLKNIGPWVKEAAKEASFVALPESFFSMGASNKESLLLHEPFGRGLIQDQLAAWAAAYGIYLLAGTVPISSQYDQQKRMASSLLYAPNGDCIARYDKIHLFDVWLPEGEESYQESAVFSPGKATCTVEVENTLFGLSVCFDVRFPELYRALVKQGACVLTVPAAFAKTTGEKHWGVLLRARAVENQCFVIAPNQWGTHPNGRQTYGHTQIIDPWGDVLACQPEGDGYVVASLDFSQQKILRQHFPVLGNL